ncbi:hypothetical protein L596_018596 [Steinernema carpocapsae]|uniref:FHF complex subunit HOOK-interacting protein C-terminal domain-containing protein n=1 Tax=Steinernema carpocapsae TaxID=34508 RepID=A0A4U5N552_STECR|nr:hypothetical protein L596_018596 [Steinernema carpocapsae]
MAANRRGSDAFSQNRNMLNISHGLLQRPHCWITARLRYSVLHISCCVAGSLQHLLFPEEAAALSLKMKWWSSPKPTPESNGESRSASSTPRRTSSLFGSLKASLSGGWNADFASDPGSWEQLFEKQFEVLDEALTKEHSLKTVREIFEKLRLMCQLLMMEVNSQPEAVIGPILDKFFSFGILDEVERWAEKAPPLLVPTCQVEFVRLYEDILNGSHSDNHCLLVHKPILLPLLQMLEWFREGIDKREKSSSDIDRNFVVLLNQICSKMAEDATLLDFFFNFRTDSDTNSSGRQFIVFNLLIRYLYDSSDTGQLARDALLLILSVTKELNEVAEYVAFRSNFCPVLATGLSGCYSELSSHICLSLNVAVDWNKINVETDVEAIPALTSFHNALLFCNAVIQTAHKLIGIQIVDFFYHGFLQSVVLTSFQQNGIDEIVSVTAYFHLCLETVTETPLIQALIKLLIVETVNGSESNLLELILKRMADMRSERLCQVTLSLISTLTDLRCEDVMWQAIFKYIVPFSSARAFGNALHVRHPIYDANASMDASERFLEFIPECVRSVSQLNSKESFCTVLSEARSLINSANVSCSKWLWNYDGITPNTILSASMTGSDLSGGRQFFTRLSSARSSMASNGLNRYFTNRSAHVTAESLNGGEASSISVLKTLNELGTTGGDDEDADFYRDEEFGVEGSDEANEDGLFGDDEMPPTTSQYDLMTQSKTDYFQFTYDDISSDDEVVPKTLEDKKKISVSSLPKAPKTPKYTPTGGWSSKGSTEDFLDSLKKVPLDPKRDAAKRCDENMARIDAKLQYFTELKEEEEAARKEEESVVPPLTIPPMVREELKLAGNGILMDCCERLDKPVLISCIYSLLENLLYNSFEVNLQLTSLLKSLVAFPNPMLVSYFLNPEDPLTKTDVKSLFQILSNLGVLINSYASSIEGFNTALERGIRFFKTREERIEKARHQPLSRAIGLSPSVNGKGTPEETSRFGMFRNSIRKRTTEFRHAKIAQTAETRAETARTKQIVYAAIFQSQICQEMAAFTLQHALTVKLPAKCSQQSRN